MRASDLNRLVQFPIAATLTELTREPWATPDILRAAPRAPHSGLDGSHLSRPSFLIAEQDEASGVEYGHALAASAINPQTVSVATEITDVI